MSSGYAVEAESSYPTMEKRNKKSKPSFIKRWLLKSLKEAAESERSVELISASDIGIKQSRGLSIGPPSIDQPERAIQFTVYPANGGRVIETRRYDRQKDRHTNGLYVITGEQDFGREIDKIITMESLK